MIPFRNRILKDLMIRSRMGITIYIMLWSIIIFSTGLYRVKPLFSWSVLALFFLISLLRLIQQPYYLRSSARHHRFHFICLIINILLPAIIWSALFALSMFKPIHSEFKVLMLLTTTGLCSGGTSSYLPDKRLALTFLAIMLLPTATLLIFFNRGELPTLLITLCYFSYMVLVTLKGSNEYQYALMNEAKLEEKSNELKRISETDGLTGAYNRRYFNRIFDIEWKRSSRDGYPLTLIIIDLDHFKKVNDTYGHQAGDEVLKTVTLEFKKAFKRCTDVVVRYGGEEFAILLPGIDSQTALARSESLRRKIESMHVTYEGLTIRTTISAGIASCIPSHSQPSEILLTEADKALYKAKNMGRNQTQTMVIT
ncbi:MAG: GGDEF domain-containing protein [Desulfobacterium sp.]|nr:GGDEF domain-containing protein [Desulfobacterium sp.]